MGAFPCPDRELPAVAVHERPGHRRKDKHRLHALLKQVVEHTQSRSAVSREQQLGKVVGAGVQRPGNQRTYIGAGYLPALAVGAELLDLGLKQRQRTPAALRKERRVLRGKRAARLRRLARRHSRDSVHAKQRELADRPALLHCFDKLLGLCLGLGVVERGCYQRKYNHGGLGKLLHQLYHVLELLVIKGFRVEVGYADALVRREKRHALRKVGQLVHVGNSPEPEQVQPVALERPGGFYHHVGVGAGEEVLLAIEEIRGAHLPRLELAAERILRCEPEYWSLSHYALRHFGGELFAAEDVEMHMLYALTAILTAVIYNTVAVCKSE